MSWGCSKRYYLKHYGESTTGYVQSIINKSNSRKARCRFTYYVNDKKYSNTIRFNKVDIGETVVVKYIKRFPQVSTLEKKLMPNY